MSILRQKVAQPKSNNHLRLIPGPLVIGRVLLLHIFGVLRHRLSDSEIHWAAIALGGPGKQGQWSFGMDDDQSLVSHMISLGNTNSNFFPHKVHEWNTKSMGMYIKLP